MMNHFLRDLKYLYRLVTPKNIPIHPNDIHITDCPILSINCDSSYQTRDSQLMLLVCKDEIKKIIINPITKIPYFIKSCFRILSNLNLDKKLYKGVA